MRNRDIIVTGLHLCCASGVVRADDHDGYTNQCNRNSHALRKNTTRANQFQVRQKLDKSYTMY